MKTNDNFDMADFFFWVSLFMVGMVSIIFFATV